MLLKDLERGRWFKVAGVTACKCVFKGFCGVSQNKGAILSIVHQCLACSLLERLPTDYQLGPYAIVVPYDRLAQALEESFGEHCTA